MNPTTNPRRYACWCALQVSALWNCPPVVKQYLETGDEKLMDAARDAAEIGYADAQSYVQARAAYAAFAATWKRAENAADAASKAAYDAGGFVVDVKEHNETRNDSDRRSSQG